MLQIFVALMDIRDRLGSVIEAKGLTVNSFAAPLAVTRTAIYDIVGGKRNKPSADVLTSIMSAYPDINSFWLLTGQGEMFVKEADPVASSPPIAEVRKSSKTKPLLSVAKGLNPAWQAKVRILPGVKASAGAGYITEAITESRTKEVFIPGLAPSQADGYLGLFADGDSMEPTIFDGDLMVIDQVLNPVLELKVGQVYVVLTINDDSYVKRLTNLDPTNLCFASDNKARRSYGFSVTDIQKIFRVVLKISTNLGKYTHPSTDELMEAYGDRLSLVEAANKRSLKGS